MIQNTVFEDQQIFTEYGKELSFYRGLNYRPVYRRTYDAKSRRESRATLVRSFKTIVLLSSSPIPLKVTRETPFPQGKSKVEDQSTFIPIEYDPPM